MVGWGLSPPLSGTAFSEPHRQTVGATQINGNCFQRAGKAGVRWPVNELMLERTLYPGKNRSRSSASPLQQTPVTTVPSKPKRRGRRPNFPLAFKLALVEQSMQPGVSSARLARELGTNDSLLFNWLNLYKHGRLGAPLPAEPCPLPVERDDVPSSPPITESDKAPPSDVAECELVLPGGTLRFRACSVLPRWACWSVSWNTVQTWRLRLLGSSESIRRHLYDGAAHVNKTQIAVTWLAQSLN